jgi:hypothetical protein
MRCDKCDREMIDDEPAWRRWHGYRGHNSLCAGCSKSDSRYYRKAHPCARCGRPVHHDAIRKLPTIVACGPRCQALICWTRSNVKRDRRHPARDRRRPPREPPAHDCIKCGERFTFSRLDARYCSGKCRQAHWRLSRHNGSAADSIPLESLHFAEHAS